MEVAQPAAGLFQVRLQQEGDVAEGPVTLFDLGGEHGEPLAGVPLPLGEGLLEHGLGDSGVTGHHPTVEQPELDPEVSSGHLQHLRSSSDGMVEVDTFVPDGVPDGVCHTPDVPSTTTVDENDIEIAEGAQLAPPVAPHGHKCDAVRIPVGCPLEQSGQPPVGRGRECSGEFVALEVGSRQQLLAQRAEGHK